MRVSRNKFLLRKGNPLSAISVNRLRPEWGWSYRAWQWFSYRNYAVLPLMAGALCYTAAGIISQDTFHLKTMAPFYEARTGTRFRFKAFKNWDEIAAEFAAG